jgi:hypothetical protein
LRVRCDIHSWLGGKSADMDCNSCIAVQMS